MRSLKAEIKANVKCCARCEANHGDLTFQTFRIPLHEEGLLFTHWATCPTTQEPILMRFIATEDKETP